MPAPSPVPLLGGTANYGRVLRVGDTVCRPWGSHTPAVHRLLEHLESRGFTGSPRVLSPEDQPGPVAETLATIPGTEVLGYIDGTAASEPLPGWASGDAALASVGRLLRAYHDHAASFDGTGLPWHPDLPIAWRGDLVTHNDVNPANVVFRDGSAVALIDFDLAALGCAAWDLALAACFWVPLRDDPDLSALHRSRRAERYRLLLEAYGADRALARSTTHALAPANRWIASVVEDAARDGHPAFGRVLQRKQEVHQRADVWLTAHAGELAAAVAAHR